MTSDEAQRELIEWMKRMSNQNIDNKHVSAMLLVQGAGIAFQSAPTEEEAITHIQNMISEAWQQCSKIIEERKARNSQPSE